MLSLEKTSDIQLMKDMLKVVIMEIEALEVKASPELVRAVLEPITDKIDDLFRSLSERVRECGLGDIVNREIGMQIPSLSELSFKYTGD